MPVITPYQITVQHQGQEYVSLALAISEEAAIQRYLLRKLKVRRFTERQAYIDTGRVETVELYPYMTFKGEHTHAVFALNHEDAIHRTRDTFIDERPFVQPCDPWFAIERLSDDVLLLQCYMVWTKWRPEEEKSKPEKYGFNLQHLIGQAGDRKSRRTANISPGSRLMMVANLRLAMLLNFIPVTWDKNFNRPSRNPQVALERDEAGEREFVDLHKDNIGAYDCRQIYHAVGPNFATVSTETVEQVSKFCYAYGYNPDSLSMSEVTALWYKGVKGLEEARLKRELGLLDMFMEYGVKRWKKTEKTKKEKRNQTFSMSQSKASKRKN